jgi:hypothetical protein
MSETPEKNTADSGAGPIASLFPGAGKAYYANGFAVVLGNSDILCAFSQNGEVAFTVNLSYSTAKTLAAVLAETLGRLESASGNTIMTVPVIDEAIQRSEGHTGELPDAEKDT